jgi:hypothetical protein
MSRVEGPRNLCSIWASETFGEAVENIRSRESEIISELNNQLEALGLTDKPVTGDAIRGLQRTQEGRGGGISYTDTFFEASDEFGSYSPIDYLYLLVRKSHSKGFESSKITGILARSMRTYASLLRDKDFAATLHQELAKEKSSKDFEVKTDPIEDAKNHTDVLVKTDDKVYRIWLFQYTSMGLPHDIERITGERGALPRGVHILCPLKSGGAMDFSNASEAIKKIEPKLAELEVRIKEAKGRTKELQKLEAMKERLRGRLAELESKKESLSKELAGEVEICEGWYFYPTQKVREVLQMIRRISNGDQIPEKYANVCKILNLPKEHLSRISSFEI